MTLVWQKQPLNTQVQFEYVPTPLSAGGVGIYNENGLKYTVIERASNQAFQAMWITIHFTNKRDIICGVTYRQHNGPQRNS